MILVLSLITILHLDAGHTVVSFMQTEADIIPVFTT